MEKLVNENIILIGTAHVSKKSVAEVESAIKKYQPEIVAVELDDKRYQSITKKQNWDKTSVLEVIKSGKGFLLLVQTFLAMIQRKLGKEFGVEPGAEMIAAIKSAKKYELAIALVDRDITITFKRAWKLMTVREKLRLFWYSIKALVGYDRIEDEFEDELDAELSKKEKELGISQKDKARVKEDTKKVDKEMTDDETAKRKSREAALERLMQEDVISAMMEELRQVVPNATKALIDERDQYISKKILGYVDGTETKFVQFKKKISKSKSDVPEKLEIVQKSIEHDEYKEKEKDKDKEKTETKAKSQSKSKVEVTVKFEADKKVTKTRGKQKRVLAVVGAGHINGIKKNLKHPDRLPSLKDLEQTPKKRFSIMKAVGYLIPILFAALFAYLVYFAKWDVLLEVLLAWFLINGICSAIGAAIALGHPVTILAAFVAAPFTSLNPTIGAGWVAGYVEVKVNAPTVQDIRKLSKVETFKDFFGNRLIRLLMVMALANLGSMIGTFIAGYYIGDLVLF